MHSGLLHLPLEAPSLPVFRKCLDYIIGHVIFSVILKMQRHELDLILVDAFQFRYSVKRQTDCLRRVLHALMGSSFLGRVCELQRWFSGNPHSVAIDPVAVFQP